jgi:CheY-like chemotaxis protein
MNGVLGMTELLLGTPLDPQQREYVEMVKDSAESLLTVINDVLDFSKIEAGEMIFEPREFGLRETIATLLKPLQLNARQKGIVLVTAVADGVPDRLMADPHRLGQILLNLTANAVKFTHEGSVTVHVSMDETAADGKAMLHIEVQDTGIGIPKEKQAHIFEPFKQADGSTTRKYGGTGLGLSICTRLVDAMGGRLWVESPPSRPRHATTVAQHQGTAFHAVVAVGTAAAPRLRVVDPVDHPVRTGLHILLADDNVVNQRVAQILLERDGHRVTVVSTGADAVAAAKATAYDAILMDVQMPVMGGFEATAAIRKEDRGRQRHVPIIAMTAHAMDGDEARCLTHGMDAYVAKPMTIGELRRALAETTRPDAGIAKNPEIAKNAKIA